MTTIFAADYQVAQIERAVSMAGALLQTFVEAARRR
jgi:hypothetical protein